MFDIGFSELVLVGLIALLVFGPERLPRVAREAALWVRKARNVVSQVKDEIDHELELQDLKQSMRQQKRLLEDSLNERIGAEGQPDRPTKAAEAERSDEQT